MKTFLLAALAGVSAAQSLDNETQCLAEPKLLTFKSGDNTFELLKIDNVATGWTKNGASADVSFDFKLWFNFFKSSAGRFILSERASHKIAIANADNSAYEAQQWTFKAPSDDGSINTILTFDKYEAAMPASLENLAPTKTFPYKIEEEGVAFSDRASTEPGFWNIDNANSANVEKNLWISLTRDSPGAAEIAAGAEREAIYYFEYSTAKLDTPLVLKWAVDTSSNPTDPVDPVDPVDPDTEDEDNNTPTDPDTEDEDNNNPDPDTEDEDPNNPDPDTDTDGGANDDGATAVTTFGAAVMAAVASLMF